MSEAVAIGKVLGLEGEASRRVPCAVCKEPTPLPDFIWESVRLWNREELRLAEEANRKADFITTHELGMTCDPPKPCRGELFRRKHAESERDNETTRVYLGMLCAGKYNPESLAWLRARGHAKMVERVLAAEGTTKAHA